MGGVHRYGVKYRIHGDPGQRIFKRPEIKSAANCTACHISANRGEFYGE